MTEFCLAETTLYALIWPKRTLSSPNISKPSLISRFKILCPSSPLASRSSKPISQPLTNGYFLLSLSISASFSGSYSPVSVRIHCFFWRFFGGCCYLLLLLSFFSLNLKNPCASSAKYSRSLSSCCTRSSTPTVALSSGILYSSIFAG